MNVKDRHYFLYKRKTHKKTRRIKKKRSFEGKQKASRESDENKFQDNSYFLCDYVVLISFNDPQFAKLLFKYSIENTIKRRNESLSLRIKIDPGRQCWCEFCRIDVSTVSCNFTSDLYLSIGVCLVSRSLIEMINNPFANNCCATFPFSLWFHSNNLSFF